MAERRSHTLYDPVEHWSYPKVVSSSLTIPITFAFASFFSVSTTTVGWVYIDVTTNPWCETVITENQYAHGYTSYR